MEEKKEMASSKAKRNSYVEQLPPVIKTTMTGMDEWNFDIFGFAKACDNKPIEILLPHLLNRYGLIKAFNINPPVLEQFTKQLEVGYRKHEPVYHTSVHGADVLRNVHYLIHSKNFKKYLTDLEIFSTLVAAACHDFEHTGTTNSFHVASRSDLALIYNDRSVLENHHISASFFVIQKNECNILSYLSREEYYKFRNIFIELVLATDMSYHYQLIKHLHGQAFDVADQQEVDKLIILQLIVHTSDICGPAKEWKTAHRWTSLLFREYFAQGDREKELGLPFSSLCDRRNTSIPESQIQYMDFIVEPTLKICGDILHLFEDLSNKAESNILIVVKPTSSTDERPWDFFLHENRKSWKNMCKKCTQLAFRQDQ